MLRGKEMEGKKVDMVKTNKIIPYLAEVSFSSDFFYLQGERF